MGLQRRSGPRGRLGRQRVAAPGSAGREGEADVHGMQTNERTNERTPRAATHPQAGLGRAFSLARSAGPSLSSSAAPTPAAVAMATPPLGAAATPAPPRHYPRSRPPWAALAPSRSESGRLFPREAGRHWKARDAIRRLALQARPRWHPRRLQVSQAESSVIKCAHHQKWTGSQQSIS